MLNSNIYDKACVTDYCCKLALLDSTFYFKKSCKGRIRFKIIFYFQKAKSLRKHGRPKPRWFVSLWNSNKGDFKDDIEEQNLVAEIIHSENLELKPGEPNKNMTEDKSEKNQASNPSSEENAEKDGASAVMMTMSWMFMHTSRALELWSFGALEDTPNAEQEISDDPPKMHG